MILIEVNNKLLGESNFAIQEMIEGWAKRYITEEAYTIILDPNLEDLVTITKTPQP